MNCDSDFVNTSQNDLSGNVSILNTSLNKSCIYSPILNEIFHYKMLKCNTKHIIYNLIASILMCLFSLLVFVNAEYLFDRYFGEIIQLQSYHIIANFCLKLLLCGIFLLFFCNILYNFYILMSNIIIHGTYNNQPKTIDLSKKIKKEEKAIPTRKESPIIQLPFFSLSPSKQSTQQRALSESYQSYETSPLLNTSKTNYQTTYGLSGRQLNKFLQDLSTHEDDSMQAYGLGDNGSFLGTTSSSNNRFISYQQKLFNDMSSELRNNQYQVGIRSPSKQEPSSPIISQLVKTEGDVSFGEDKKLNDESKRISPMSASIERDSWCKAYAITRAKLDLLRENLRKWISLTIVKPLMNEIHKINDQLVQIGCGDLRVGRASISQLNAFIQTPKAAQFASLKILLPYLELTSNQEYLVQRLNELALTGCLSEYHWNSGGSFKLKEWGDFLPTDSNILMHMFCTYMNSKLLPHAIYSFGKPFTNQYFKRNELLMSETRPVESLVKIEPKIEPEIKQPALSQSQHFHKSLYIYEVKAHPPHYNVVFNEQIYEISPGRNNLFDALLCFLFIVKNEFRGVLGMVSLDSSGLNILTILE